MILPPAPTTVQPGPSKGIDGDGAGREGPMTDPAVAATNQSPSPTIDSEDAIRGPAARVLSWVDRHRRWVFAAVLLLYAAGFTGKWRVAPDSGLYMSLGRNLAARRVFVYHAHTPTPFAPG